MCASSNPLPLGSYHQSYSEEVSIDEILLYNLHFSGPSNSFAAKASGTGLWVWCVCVFTGSGRDGTWAIMMKSEYPPETAPNLNFGAKIAQPSRSFSEIQVLKSRAHCFETQPLAISTFLSHRTPWNLVRVRLLPSSSPHTSLPLPGSRHNEKTPRLRIMAEAGGGQRFPEEKRGTLSGSVHGHLKP